jgi:DUF1680 family protein
MDVNRRTFLLLGLAHVPFLCQLLSRGEMTQNSNRLVRLVFQPLPLGSIRPGGWLLAQLRIQADGLSGHLDEFWPDVADSGWIGGQAEGWERGPYWLDGVVPLAYLLDDGRLKAKVQRWMDYILGHQREDGWLGPVRDTSRGNWYQPYDPWPVFVFLKALTQYEDATGDARVIPAIQRFFRRLDRLLDEKPLFDWGQVRWADLVLSIHWLYERTGEEWLLNLAAKVHEQGFDWRAHFTDFPHTGKTRREECTLITHVVNNAMAIKQPGVWYRQSGDTGDRQAVFQIVEALDTYHGQATGVFTGDEHLAGKSPSQGTELCAVVEYLFSLETLLSIIGDPRLADRLERIAFNALPATFRPDMWAHQYDQQANQVICKVAEDNLYVNNGPDSNIFGLEPNYGCCTADMHQGWPKFASHLWMRSSDDGLVAVAHAPSMVETEIRGHLVHVELQTDYPFNETLSFAVHTPQPTRFPLYLRIPAWAEGAELNLEGQPSIQPTPGTFHNLEREWRGVTTFTLRLPMRPSLQRRYHDSVAIQRGPLIYSLRVGEDWCLVGGKPPHGDWEVYPTTPWNYALEMDLDRPERSLSFEFHPVGECPFSPDGAPIVAQAKGRRLPQWKIEHNAAGPLPESPVRADIGHPYDQPMEELDLIPYGCTNLRITEFPVLV